MTVNRISEETWARANEAYDQWDPGTPGAPGIGDVLAPFGVSKQAFYAYRRRTGRPLKSESGVSSADTRQAIDALLEALVRARLRNDELERTLKEHGIPIP